MSEIDLKENIWYSNDVEIVVTRWRSYATVQDPTEKRQARFEFLVELDTYFRTCDLDIAREIVEALSRQVHGAEYTYDHLKFRKPIQVTDKLPIMCPKHGMFEIRLIDHLLPPHGSQYAVGCRDCYNEMRVGQGGNCRKNVTMFIAESERKHNDRFDYRLVNYTNNQTIIELICNKCRLTDRDPIFQTSPNRNLAGKGCKPCGDVRRNCFHLQTMEDVIRRGWPDKYEYITLHKPEPPLTGQCITYRCKQCNHLNEKQQLSGHLNNTYGCYRCGRVAIVDSQINNFDDVIDNAKLIHGDKFTYLDKHVVVKAGKNRTYLRYSCNVCGTINKQRVDGHVGGEYGCWYCAWLNKKAEDMSNLIGNMKLYFIKLVRDNNVVYKIGVTQKSIRSRFQSLRSEGISYEICYEKEFNPGSIAYKIEQDIINTFNIYRYGVHNIDRFMLKGNTELFIEEAVPHILAYIDEYVRKLEAEPNQEQSI